jgi:hypothetical protein
MYNTQAKPSKRSPLDARLQAHLGSQLRRLFAETAQEPVPERFASLLERLETDDDAVQGKRGGEAASANTTKS